MATQRQKTYNICVVRPETKLFEIEDVFNTLKADVLLLDVSHIQILTSDYFSLIFTNKDRIYLYRPNQRISTIINMLSAGSFIKVVTQIPLDMVPYSDIIE